ncbi:MULTISPECIES: acylneuraminate cytidylyltransferase family protein [Clostridium]|uniref:Acylneuraminate cytidylyltransferase family protein n=2 Tax=Clostridium TaxID=1485 RepID=A0A846J569_CLOBO|nr:MULTISPECIES: acylneuraminate cytidylyltransferase family protein [Clostridium]NFH67291.1 acylneuraminate cytidylyltransferase family protein [Clostridium botulinum]ACA55836.1 N-acylneuraminate cytidylyltransferase [Clostridium botulinum A3 str. Loch Maree]NFJ09089.1 acylneuraminate cytidylyltransferase family protein [Clostridium botulinum]NFK13631.1 acylneuraminate cytidylyltransferase family protein [Clostridium botulinum]NFM95172.1 acylneuraminate cytidylyltransferase family protein [Cl
MNDILAIIPARGGSKGVSKKNIKEINGNPLISYTIKEATKSKLISRVIVSTEDKEIAEISRKFGAEVPFKRPIELAQDDTSGIEPIIHCIHWMMENEKYKPDYICLLQCTSPLRTYKNIDECIEILLSNDADTIVSVCESEVSPYWMKRVENGILKDFLDDEPFYARRQDLPKVYRLNGAIYIAKTEVLLKNKSWYTNKTLPYVMDKISSVDIDDILDFKFAEFIMKENKYV